MSSVPAREHVAWLLWCIDQGYLNVGDRAICREPERWVADMSEHPDDAAQLEHWLAVADEVISVVEGKT